MQPVEMTEVIGGKRYSTKTATLIASDLHWDGHNFERRGRNTFLYRTPNGNYFVQRRSQWQGEPGTVLEPVTPEDALDLWDNSLPEHEVDFEQAFPDVAVVNA